MISIKPAEVDVRQLGPLRKIGTGGQGTVYELLNGPTTLVYKEYFPRVVGDVNAATLQNFVRFQRELDEPLARKLMEHAAWPINLIRRDGVVQGFVMPRVPEEFTVELSWATGRSSVLAQVQYLLNSEDYLRNRGLVIDDMFRLEFLRDVAAVLALFHSMGITVGDLSPNNLLFSRTRPARCFFLDCDAMRLGTDSVLQQAETPEWQIHDISTEELATPASDSYKLGLLAVRLFAGDQCTRNPAALARLPQRVRRLATASLSHDPKCRPAPEKWVTPLQAAISVAAARSASPPNRRAWFRGRDPRHSLLQQRLRPRLPMNTLGKAFALTRRFAPLIPGAVFIVTVIVGIFVDGGAGGSPTPSTPYRLTPPAYSTPNLNNFNRQCPFDSALTLHDPNCLSHVLPTLDPVSPNYPSLVVPVPSSPSLAPLPDRSQNGGISRSAPGIQ